MNRQLMLEQRAKICCCRSCGSHLEVRMWVYNKYGGAGAELYCPNCNKLEYGTAPEIYDVAKDFIDSVEFNYYPDLEDNSDVYKMNVAKVCEMLAWCCKEWGVLDNQGFHLQRSDGDE